MSVTLPRVYCQSRGLYRMCVWVGYGYKQERCTYRRRAKPMQRLGLARAMARGRLVSRRLPRHNYLDSVYLRPLFNLQLMFQIAINPRSNGCHLSTTITNSGCALLARTKQCIAMAIVAPSIPPVLFGPLCHRGFDDFISGTV